MTQSSVAQLPSNRAFGLFAATITFGFGIFFWYHSSIVFSSLAFFASLWFFCAALKFPMRLSRLNLAWSRFGILLGSIFSPIILSVLFFVIFTPVAVFLRLVGRDALSIRSGSQKSYWKIRPESEAADDLKYQF